MKIAIRYVGIDPSTRTGFVALDERGEVLRAKELTGVGDKDPKRIVTLIDEIMRHIEPEDMVCIESPAMHAQGQAVGFMWGLAYALRMALFRRQITYVDVTPSQVKKFATGKGNTPKDAMAVPIFKKWGFENLSNNITDAFVIAMIARELSFSKDMGESSTTIQYEAEVIRALFDPETKKQKSRGKASAAGKRGNKTEQTFLF